MDGCKVRFADGWGRCPLQQDTEPRLRIFCEMPTKEKARDLANLMARYLGLPGKGVTEYCEGGGFYREASSLALPSPKRDER